MPSISFEIKDGKIVGREWLWKSVKRFFQTIRADGRYIWKMPEKERLTRSIQQNKYYWKVICNLVSDHTGFTPEESHQEMGKLFLSYEKNGKVFVKSTTKLKTVEFEDYMEQCRRWSAMELQIYIPLPSEKNAFYYECKEMT